MTIVTTDELADYLNGVTWTLVQQQHIENVVLPGVQQELETYLNRSVELLHVREAREPDCEGRIWPTVTPIQKVISIDYTPMGGTVFTPTPVQPSVPLTPVIQTARQWDPAGNYPTQAPNWLTHGNGQNYISMPALAGISTYAIIEYLGGYNGYVDTGLKLAMLRVAAREVERVYDNAVTLSDGAAQQKVSSDPRIKGWSAEELANWDRLRRRVVVS